MQAIINDTGYKFLYEQSHIKTQELELRIATLTHELAQMKKLIFGSKHERFVATDPTKAVAQLSLDLDAETIAACKITSATKVSFIRTKTEVTTNKPHPGRMKLPGNLRRETVVLQPIGDVAGLTKIGDEVTEILDYTPGELFVKQYIRPKYLLTCDNGTDTVITASLPGRMLEKCMAGESLLAQITVDKYMDHMPLNRQQQRFVRVGLTLAQSTLNGWVKTTLNLLIGLYALHKAQILASGYINADETGIKVLDDEKKGKTHSGFYWVYHSIELKASLFEYQEGRGGEGPNKILETYQGFLQTDGYKVYEQIGIRKGITHLLCMAHARRYFMEAMDSDKPRAEHALKLIQQLYAIEARIRNEAFSAEEIVKVRLSEAVPILEELKKWMTTAYMEVLPKSPIGKAIAYSLPRWDKLTIYTTNARLNIDNNPVENAIRPVAIGRKNYLFAGSHEAAQRAAMIYSFFNTCRLHQINPYLWLKDVLEKMHLHTSANLHQLLPQNWAKNQMKDMG